MECYDVAEAYGIVANLLVKKGIPFERVVKLLDKLYIDGSITVNGKRIFVDKNRSLVCITDVDYSVLMV